MSIQEKKFIDKIGISYLWNLIKSTFVSHTELDTVIDAVEETINDTEQTLNDKIDNQISINGDAEDTKISINTDGVEIEIPTMEDIPDIQINGSSIVENGVANIPIGGQGIPGVFSIHPTYGFGVSGTNIVLNQADNNSISGRSNTFSKYRSITVGNMDFAVKAALTDGKGAAYTDEEKASARLRLGISDIPLANTNETPGLIKGNTLYGYTMNNGSINGYVRQPLNYKSDSNSLIISKGTLDNVLSTPSIMPALTETEKVSARERLGAVGTDDLANAGFDTDENGNIIITGNMVGNGDGSGLDVQINGTSIVQDGIANIPLGSYEVEGLVKITPGRGLTIDGSSSVYLTSCTSSKIDERNQNYIRSLHQALTLIELDYAVKAAMCDGIGQAWTQEEQKAAQIRLGIYPMSEEGY